MNEAINEILKLSVEERILAVEKIWDSIAEERSAPVPNWHFEILQDRIRNHNKNPENGKSWEEIRAKYSGK